MASSDFKKILRRFTITFTPLRWHPSVCLKTYNKYLVGIVISLRPPIAGTQWTPIMIFAALSRCRICLQITTREIVTLCRYSLSLHRSCLVPRSSIANRLVYLFLTPPVDALSVRFPSFRPRSFQISPIQSGLHYFVVRPRSHHVLS